MSDEITFKMEGQEDFIATIDRLIDSLHPDKVEPVLKKGAQMIAAEVRKRAPVRGSDQGRAKPPGVLKKAVRTKQLKRYGSNPAPAIAAIDQKKAPHAWLVTHGTSGVRQVRPPRRVVINGRPAVITNTGIMPPNRFFSEAVEAKQGEVLAHIEKAVIKELEGAIK